MYIANIDKGRTMYGVARRTVGKLHATQCQTRPQPETAKRRLPAAAAAGRPLRAFGGGRGKPTPAGANELAKPRLKARRRPVATAAPCGA